MSNSFLKTLKKLQEQRQVFLRDGEANLQDFITVAVDCFHNSIQEEEQALHELDDVHTLSLHDIKFKVSKLREEGNKTSLLLADYLNSAILLYEYSLAVPEYSLAIEPAAAMLAANLVSLGILPAYKEKLFSERLKEQLQGIPSSEHLEEEIKKAVEDVCKEVGIRNKDTIEKVYQLMMKTFAERDRHAQYGKEEYEVSLKELMVYALQQYRDFHPIIEEHRETDLNALEEIIAKADSPEQLEEETREYLSSMQRTLFGSHLKTLCTRALEYYQDKKSSDELVHRTLRTKDYMPPNNPNPQTHVLAIHGLEDSLKTWDILAQKWVGKGFAVHTYDQAGHGLDSYRQGNTKPILDPTVMHLDLYQKLERLAADPQVKTLHIYAHSFGGGLVSNSLHTINRLFKDKNVEIHLITPAAMKTNVFSLFTKTGEDISKDANTIRKIGPSRQGSVSIFTLLGRLIRFMSRSLDNLRHYMQREDTLPMYVHEAEQDKKVDKIDLQIQELPAKHRFFRHENAGHNLHQEEVYAERIVNPS